MCSAYEDYVADNNASFGFIWSLLSRGQGSNRLASCTSSKRLNHLRQQG